ncbi:hypothetical protein Q5425_28545 [Amycolatopsis sp. A133]|uniref:hypothetical protein n=1 Tax=Amycolatopsis sp. A133 TaxID=3064472 RepID=UPI0027E8B5B6|nr:hypothetical protein [Amycolatopsis sp. A133]MDQ7807702.1 hypothetical protein [Amycolatopsis sp. A133]
MTATVRSLHSGADGEGLDGGRLRAARRRRHPVVRRTVEVDCGAGLAKRYVLEAPLR